MRRGKWLWILVGTCCGVAIWVVFPSQQKRELNGLRSIALSVVERRSPSGDLTVTDF